MYIYIHEQKFIAKNVYFQTVYRYEKIEEKSICIHKPRKQKQNSLKQTKNQGYNFLFNLSAIQLFQLFHSKLLLSQV